MRERAITSSVIWIATVVGIDQLLEKVNVASSGFVQISMVVLVGLIMCCAAGATIAMWVTAHDNQGSDRAVRESAEQSKQKRRDPQREARVRRLLDTLDDEDIEALEHFDYGEDGERTSVEALLRRR